MSVAFRRDSDEEHLEPKFELPIPPGPNLVTARGLAQIEAKVIEIEARLRGLSDEAEIQTARRDLRYWRTRQATAQIVAPPDGNTVAFGCTVLFRLNDKERSITIVGDDEADPAKGLVSFAAPLSRAMMNASEGDLVAFAGNPDSIEILGVTAPSV